MVRESIVCLALLADILNIVNIIVHYILGLVNVYNAKGWYLSVSRDIIITEVHS